MPTNKIGKDSKTIGLNMKITEAADLERRAKSMGLSTGMYCKVVLRNWVKSEKKLVISE